MSRRDTTDISSAAQEYLLALRVMGSDGRHATASQIGRHLGVSTQAASEMFKRLVADGLVAHETGRELELTKGDFSLVYASHRLGRALSEIPNIKRILQTVWHQITAANEVFVIGAIQENGTVRGGTGWGAELARLWKKPLFVFDQKRHDWFRWSGTAWEIAALPTITSESFAGIGTQNLTEEGRAAIAELFQRSFGPPPG